MWQLEQNRTCWNHTDQIISQWLTERQALLVVYYELCQCNSEVDLHSEPERIQHLCQLLIDYVSVGHFKIFEKLAQAQSHSLGVTSELDAHLLTQILRSTLSALDFNDTYEKSQNYTNLAEDLSALGQNLADRMDWEDQLIKNYLDITQNTKPLRIASI